MPADLGHTPSPSLPGLTPSVCGGEGAKPTGPPWVPERPFKAH